MDEAKFSITTKYVIDDFDTMLTMRYDRSAKLLLKAHKEALQLLEKSGALPRRNNGSSETSTSGPEKQAAGGNVPLCPSHGVSRQGKRGYYCPTKLENGCYCTWEA